MQLWQETEDQGEPLPPIGWALDATSVGRPVAERARKRIAETERAGLIPRGVVFKPVTVTAGQSVRGTGDGFVNCAKVILVTTTERLMQNGDLLLSADVENREVLMRELQNFKRTLNTQGIDDMYVPVREKEHDDQAFALFLAVWLQTRPAYVHKGIRLVKRGPAVGYVPSPVPDPTTLPPPAMPGSRGRSGLG